MRRGDKILHIKNNGHSMVCFFNEAAFLCEDCLDSPTCKTWSLINKTRSSHALYLGIKHNQQEKTNGN